VRIGIKRVLRHRKAVVGCLRGGVIDYRRLALKKKRLLTAVNAGKAAIVESKYSQFTCRLYRLHEWRVECSSRRSSLLPVHDGHF
jgi:hypothetical protein